MKYLFTSIMALIMGAWLNVATADQASYVLGAGDVLKISVYNNPDLSLEARITESGSISFPLVGEVLVGGMTAVKAEKTIATLLQEGGFIKEPQVNILVVQFQSKLISVLGSVYKPGRYPLDRATNLSDLLAQVGGITPDGSEIVTVVTGSGKVQYDLHDIIGGDATKNIALTGGETIYVPRIPVAYIYGEVQRPSSFRVERDMTVVQALALGGGPTMRGTQRDIQLYRRNVENIVVKIPVELTDAVEQGDVLYVQESLF